MPRWPGLDASGGPPIYVAIALTCVSDTAQATTLFIRSYHIVASVTVCYKPLIFFLNNLKKKELLLTETVVTDI